MSFADMAPIEPRDWNLATATHLLNRAGFGAPRSLAARLADMPPAAAVDYLVDYERIPYNFPEPKFVIPLSARRELYKEAKRRPEEEGRKLRNDFNRAEREALVKLSAWWLERMAETPRPLEEKLTLMWHGHYATSAQKVQQSIMIHNHIEMIRRNASGNIKTLTTEVGKSPVMLRYLDNDRSTKKSPNENWARELMELFTMGVGNYTERDIKESARAFTGWAQGGGRFVYKKQNHDDGIKTFMGRTGNLQGEDIIDIIFEQPVTPRFFANELWTFFAYPEPEPGVVDAVAATLRETNYEIKPALRQMFLAKAFYSEKSMGMQVKSPVHFVVQLAHDLQLDPAPYLLMHRASTSLGQDIFRPPNVKGWDGGDAWINANALLRRYNLPPDLVAAPPEPQPSMMAYESFDMAAMMSGNMMSMNKMMEKRGKEMRENVGEMLKSLPRGQAKQWRDRISATKNPEKRRQLVLELMEQVNPDARWSANKLFDMMHFKNAGEAVDALEARYLTVRLSADQQDVLIRALGATRPSDPLTPESVPIENKNATLHLLVSSAEYQIC